MNTLNEFIANLTGQHGLTLSQLTSAQKARAIAWARDSGVEIDGGLTPVVENENISAHDGNSYESVPSQVKTGIDIQSIKEFFPLPIDDLKSDKSLLNIFTMSEMSYAESKAEPLTHLTGMFALKEAIMKASNAMLEDISVIEITHDSGGAPKHGDYTLSLSYTGDLVVAIAIAISVTKDRSGTTNNQEIEERLLNLESALKVLTREAPSLPLSLKIGFIALFFVSGYFLLQYIRLYLI
jgi:phosphopantetheine--protein transferase-like protein